MPAKLNSPRRPWEPEKSKGKQQGRQFETDFYQTSEWKIIRKIHLAAHPLCAPCEKKGRTTIGNTVDHKKPISKGGDPRDPNNLQTTCTRCHNSKSGKERHGIYEY